jgi:hypothetical protein
MSLGRPILNPLLRSLAVLALTVFASAQTMCFLHCHVGGGSGHNNAQPSCHGSAQARHSHDRQDTPAPAPSAPCSTLKTMMAGGDAPTVIAPQWHTLPLLFPVVLTLDATKAPPQTSLFRQAWTRDRVRGPEVYLGPAFRSLAPPFVG